MSDFRASLHPTLAISDDMGGLQDKYAENHLGQNLCLESGFQEALAHGKHNDCTGI